MGIIHRDCLVLAVPDPAGVRIGSGGATLNALAVVWCAFRRVFHKVRLSSFVCWCLQSAFVYSSWFQLPELRLAAHASHSHSAQVCISLSDC